jgi:hypothetical protein
VLLLIRQPLCNRNLEIFPFEVLMAHSPELAPSDYCLFHNLKKHLAGRKFCSTEEAALALASFVRN